VLDAADCSLSTEAGAGGALVCRDGFKVLDDLRTGQLVGPRVARRSRLLRVSFAGDAGSLPAPPLGGVSLFVGYSLARGSSRASGCSRGGAFTADSAAELVTGYCCWPAWSGAGRLARFPG